MPSSRTFESLDARDDDPNEEARLLQDETNAAWHGFAGFAERLAALESRMNEADEGAAKLQELAIARANR